MFIYYPFIYLYINPFIYLYINSFIYLYINPLLYLCINPFIYLYINPFIYLYINPLFQILTEFLTTPYKTFNECVELMSYVFIHPAFEKEQKKAFKNILKQILHRNTPDNYNYSPANGSSDGSVSPNVEKNSPAPVPAADEVRLNRRSNSLTPGQTSSHESLIPGQEVWSSQENLTQQLTKQRSCSLSNDQGKAKNQTHKIIY